MAFLSLRPQNVAPDTWYYEERSGLSIYHVVGGTGSELVCIIPWRKLNVTMERYRKHLLAMKYPRQFKRKRRTHEN